MSCSLFRMFPRVPGTTKPKCSRALFSRARNGNSLWLNRFTRKSRSRRFGTKRQMAVVAGMDRYEATRRSQMREPTTRHELTVVSPFVQHDSAVSSTSSIGQVDRGLSRRAARTRQWRRGGIPSTSHSRRRDCRRTSIVGHKTESIYRRYAIVDAGALRDAAAKIDRAAGASTSKTENSRAESA